MSIFINGTGNISPQKTWENSEFLEQVTAHYGRMVQCLEPETDPGLDEKYLRRMSRMIRLGWCAAKICLDDAGNLRPDAIITGSGWGSVQDSEKFLLSIYRNNENLLPPTPFIQSTHNAVSAQIAMLQNNSSYNMAYAHSSHAFEHALLDAAVSLANGDFSNILLGGFDEITPNQFILMDRLDRWKKNDIHLLDLFKDRSDGTIAGEGFTFFFLQNHQTETTYAEIKDVLTLFDTGDPVEIAARAQLFLEKNGLEPGLIDLVMAGFNGDTEGDRLYHEVLSRLSPSDMNLAAWKHLTGDYLTSTAFATWAAAKAFKINAVPEILRINAPKKKNRIKNILIFNHFKKIHHSFILISKPA